MISEQLKGILEKEVNARNYLFIRGFLVTDSSDVNIDEFPFYGKWSCKNKGKYKFLTHPLAHVYFAEIGSGGGVYLPFGTCI